MLTPDFYRQQAAEQRIAADAATLDNVRERCERAAKAWEKLASGLDGIERRRLERSAPTLTDVLLSDLTENPQ